MLPAADLARLSRDFTAMVSVLNENRGISVEDFMLLLGDPARAPLMLAVAAVFSLEGLEGIATLTKPDEDPRDAVRTALDSALAEMSADWDGLL
jgi:hypothetical protein